jgi:hypothetical protein
MSLIRRNQRPPFLPPPFCYAIINHKVVLRQDNLQPDRVVVSKCIGGCPHCISTRDSAVSAPSGTDADRPAGAPTPPPRIGCGQSFLNTKPSSPPAAGLPEPSGQNGWCLLPSPEPDLHLPALRGDLTERELCRPPFAFSPQPCYNTHSTTTIA